MVHSNFTSITGTILQASPISGDCCNFLVTVRTNQGVTNLTVSPSTYVIDNIRLHPGMQIIGFYDSNAPVPLLFPPQFRAVVIGRLSRENIAFNFFDENLISTDNSLKLTVRNNTVITTANGQHYTCSVANRLLIVFYSRCTRSIPSIIIPRRIIVFC